jgi:hypothetical protein
MSKNTEEDKSRWDQMMEHLDLLFSRVDDIGTVQQQMKAQMDIRGAAMDSYAQQQQLIAQQVKANGAAVVQLTLRSFAEDAKYDSTSASDLSEEEQPFENLFAKGKEVKQPETHKQTQSHPKHYKKDTKDSLRGKGDYKEPSTVRQHRTLGLAMPKMLFPEFDGTDPKIWRDNCESYFELYQLLEGMWITAAHIHFEGNAAKWYQAYKQSHTFQN